MTIAQSVQQYISSKLSQKIHKELPFVQLGKLSIKGLAHNDKVDFGIHYLQKRGVIPVIDINYYYVVTILNDMQLEDIINDMYEIFKGYLV